MTVKNDWERRLPQGVGRQPASHEMAQIGFAAKRPAKCEALGLQGAEQLREMHFEPCGERLAG
ncbi:hypothetical protein V6O07_15540, partial [Arthrospira platensis SPKY2]